LIILKLTKKGQKIKKRPRMQVALTVLNTLGLPVSTLVSGTEEPGCHEVRFNGTELASGVYFYRLQAGGFVQTRKLVLLR
jgi:hypothetical protein